MVLTKTGHGMILDGQTKNGKTYLYVGCDVDKVGKDKDGKDIMEATGVARIDYAAMPKYEYKDSKWVYSKSVDKKKKKTLTTGFYDKSGKVTIDHVQKSSIDKKCKITKFSSLLSKKEKFVKGDFCVADTGAHMVYVKYTKNKKNMMKVRKLSDVFEQITKQVK